MAETNPNVSGTFFGPSEKKNIKELQFMKQRKHLPVIVVVVVVVVEVVVVVVLCVVGPNMNFRI